VAQPTDETNTGTLPDPELNPLLNPLLAANMGRWAEVYFTNPPEKRAQAVADLLRELEQNPQPEHVSKESMERIPGKILQPLEREDEERHKDVLIRDSYSGASSSSAPDHDHNAVETEIICQACAHSNLRTQRFCGMCGMPLSLTESDSIASPEHPSVRQTSWHDQDSSRETGPAAGETNFYAEPQSRYEKKPNELASLYPVSDDDDGAPDSAEGLFHYQSEPRRSYRLYIGMALAIIVTLLVYRAWRGNATLLSAGSAPSALPQAVPDSQSPEASKPTEPAPTAPTQQSSQNPEASGAAENPPAQPQQKPRADRLLNARHATAPSASKLTTASEQTPVNAQNGAEELATAEKYLNGGTHDPQQAASWLWKSVAKQNMTAALLLSDLYVHGDGVAKSCDQARLLLDATARKGSTAAAVRLRNLPAFGCQ
jgi:hypothetical protein